MPPAHPDPNYGPGVLPIITPFGRASHHMPLNFSSESNIEVNILEWEAKCDQNTAAILVLEAQYIIKRNAVVWILQIMYDVSEASNRCTFEARWLGLGLPEACQQPTWSPDMRQDCIKTIRNITTMNATTFKQNIGILEPELKYWWVWPSRLHPNISTLRPCLAKCAKLLKYKPY